ncbi:MAG TPA: HAD-IC family P-type ATPase, partial [Polyangia bacterium]
RAATLYAGTSVATGHGRAVVTATGNATELGRVRQELERARAPEAPLTRRLGQVTNRVTLLAVGAAAAAAGVGVLRRQPGAAVLRSAVALGVATIPEGLPLVATAALIRSMQRLREQGMIVRRLAAAETLGGVTVICADKTGTLTRNEMRLEVLELAGGRVDLATARARGDAPLEDPFTLALMIGLLNSDVEVQRGGGAATVSGSSTERALVQAAWAAGLDGARLRLAFPRRLLRERDGAMRYVVSIHDTPAGGAVTLVKGAPEQVVALCDRGATGPLDDAARARLLARNADLAGAGLRVLALAFAPGGQPDPRGGLTFVGLAALRDPPRAGARAAIADAARAGVRTLMLTGDQRLTAEAIARAVGLAGETLGRDEALALAREPSGAAAARLRRVAVIARVTPSDKAEVVRALRRSGELVAMAGDGINDAPALKLADVGMAVGSSASDLAREVADVVLAREELSALVAAVGEGRVVQDNLRRAVRFLVATNLSETALMIGGLLVAGQAPLTPLQLLWINLLSDTLPALALALDRGRPGILDRPPAAPGAPILTSAARRVIVRDGLWLGLAGGAGFVLGGPRLAMPVLVGAQLGYTALCRAPDVGGDGEFARLLGAAAGLQLATLLIPPLRRVLGLGPVTGLEIAAYAGALAAPLWASRRRRLRPVVARGRAVNPSLERSRP